MESPDPLAEVPKTSTGDVSDNLRCDNETKNQSSINYEWDESSLQNSLNKDDFSSQFNSISYRTNYLPTIQSSEPVLHNTAEKRETNLRMLKAFYHEEALNALATRKDSCISQLSASPSSRYSRQKHPLTHRFPSWNVDRLHEEHKSSKSYSVDTSMEHQASEAAKIYQKYKQKFASAIGSSALNDDAAKENMWVPIAAWNPNLADMNAKLYTSFKIRLQVPYSDTCPITVTKLYPPVFSETKVPALAYHSIVNLNSSLFILGGLSPCYDYSDTAPDLSSLHVDGIKNLPPPLDPAVINNPSMIPNKHLYTFDYSSSKWKKAETSGQNPPPLICIQGSMLTDRHIFYYGGFEIKHEVSIDEKTNEYFIKKRAVLNDTAYILDTLCLKFAKIQLVAQPTKYVKFPNTVPRFGHLQVSLKTHSYKSSKSASTGLDSPPSSSSSSSNDRNAASNTLEDPMLNFVSSSMTLNSDSIISPTSSSTPGVYTILIMGGYKDGEDERFEPISDLWKVEVTVLSRGKRNFLKFADTALVTIISSLPQKSTDEALKREYYKKWPLPRGFMASYITDTDALKSKTMDEGLLEKLMQNFKIIENVSEKPMNADTPAPKRTMAHPSLTKRLNKTLIIHGGSANGHIHGDMWFYDLDEGTWTKSVLQARDKETGDLRQVEFPLTGHTLIDHKQITVVIGGMNQLDVEQSRHWKNWKSHTERLHPIHQTSGAFTFINVPMRTIKNFPVDSLKAADRSKYTDDMMLSALRLCCNPVIYENDYVWTVGGLIGDTENSRIYLRGAISLVSFPWIDIADK